MHEIEYVVDVSLDLSLDVREKQQALQAGTGCLQSSEAPCDQGRITM